MTLQEAAEKYADENFNTSGIYTPYGVKQKLIACYMHRQAEIDELKRWKAEMLELWNKLDGYLQTRKDITIGQSKIDRAIQIMKERDDLSSKLTETLSEVSQLLGLLKHHLPDECIERYAEVKFCPIRNGDGWQCKECAS